MTGAVAGGAPVWVYFLLAMLVILGVRRLRTREMPILVALIPSAAFLTWSLVGAGAFAGSAGAGIAIPVWLTGAAIGAVSAVLLPEPRGVRLPNGRVRLPASWLPLVLYMAVFAARFACGAWAAIDPSAALSATATGLAVSAAMTARLIVAVLRWRTSDVGAATA